MAINDGDYDQAVADIYEYVILLTNEVGAYVLHCKHTDMPGGDLKINTLGWAECLVFS